MPFDVGKVAPVNPRAIQPGTAADIPGRMKNEPSPKGLSFAETLKGYLREVSELEKEADRQVRELAQNRTTNVHDVMLAVEEANLALDLLIEIRNRLMETYHELSRTSL